MIRSRASAAAVALTLAAAPVFAADPEPGSVLVFPSVHEVGFATLVSVTNVSPSAGTIARYQYLNTVPSGVGDPLMPADCFVETVFENLTPSDTLTVTVRCHNPVPSDGYLVVDAQSVAGDGSVSHNFLVGSEFVATGNGAVYSLAAISFESPLQTGAGTDLDGDGELDFDGAEYAPCPDELYVDTFLASVGNRLTLINLTGGTAHVATVRITVFNDNEIPVGVELKFRCWFDVFLDLLSPAFSLPFLLGTANAPSELDLDCDGVGDLETGWALIRGVTAESPDQLIPDPALLGAVTGTVLGFERGRPLWRRGENPNGDFLGTAPVHPEFP